MGRRKTADLLTPKRTEEVMTELLAKGYKIVDIAKHCKVTKLTPYRWTRGFSGPKELEQLLPCDES